MWLKSLVDRQDKIGANVRKTDKTKSKVCQDKIESIFPFVLSDKIEKMPSLSDGQTNIYYYVIYILSARSGGQEYY